MANRDYWLRFGQDNPALHTGLAPTFTIFINASGQTLTPPSITETYAGTGLYKFAYEATVCIAFICDGATTGLGDNDRFIVGVLDPQDQMSERIGLTSSSFGSTSVDPATVFGYLRRAQEFWEGNEVYTKATGVLQFLSRGSSTLLREKTLTDNTSEVTKT